MTWTSDFLNCNGGNGFMPHHLQDLYRLAVLKSQYGRPVKWIGVTEEYNNWYLVRIDIDDYYKVRSDYYILAPGATVRVSPRYARLKDPGVIKFMENLIKNV